MLKLHQHFFTMAMVSSFIALFTALIFSYFLIENNQLQTFINLEKKIISNIKKSQKIDKEYLLNIDRDFNIKVAIIDNNKTIFNSLKENIDLKELKTKNDFNIFKKNINGNLYTIVTSKYKKGFIVIAIRQKPIFSEFYTILLDLLILFILLVLFLYYLNHKLSQKIEQDSKSINRALDEILKKNYNLNLNISCCKEFLSIAKKIEIVAKKLRKRQKQKSKYTKKLKTITKRQSDIISAISHEFKNPVAAIIGYAQTLIESPDLNSNLKSKFLHKIESNASKISNMIDTLALSIKLENESIVLNKKEFFLSEIAKSAKETLEQKYKNREIELNCSNVKVVADRYMLENVFINLIENALKYSEDKVIVNCSDKKVEIIDFGIGINEDEIKKIRDKFYRVDGISWNNSIGVGLYIVDYILKLHNLELEIKSQNKKGSIFGFKIDSIVV